MINKKQDVIIKSTDSSIYKETLLNAANKIQLQSDLIFNEFFSQHKMTSNVAMSFVFDLLINIVRSSLVQAVAVTNRQELDLKTIASHFATHLSNAIDETLKEDPNILEKFKPKKTNNTH